MRKATSFNYITLLLFCQILLCFALTKPTSAVDTENFYFDDFTADYYLTKDSKGVSKMRVVENFTTIFPDYEQNKGICRMIPRTNQNGNNVTLKKLNRNNIKVFRNGQEEPIWSINQYDNSYYEVCTGTDDYVLGRQVYTFEYVFEKVITEFNEGEKSWQELYWDANAVGNSQYYNHVKATLHLDDISILSDHRYCFVGTYGESNQSRCSISISDNSITFNAEEVYPKEILTFVVDFKPESFVVPGPEKNYIMLYIMGIVMLIAIVNLIGSTKAFIKVAPKRKFYHNYFVKPEYEPGDYSLPAAHAVYIGNKKGLETAVLLELVVKKKIELIKGGKNLLGRQKWKIKIIDTKDIPESGKLILRILNNGSEFYKPGDIIEVKSHASTSSLASLGNQFKKIDEKEALDYGLITTTYFDQSNNKKGSKWILLLILSILIVFLFVIGGEQSFLLIRNIWLDFLHNQIVDIDGRVIVCMAPATIIIIITLATSGILSHLLRAGTIKYLSRTEKGLEASRHLEGLKLYILMAEKERLEYLQSTTGVEVTIDGIVKLYEKLLPYAAIFGAEKSWIKELNNYCVVNQVETPLWTRNDFDINSFSTFLRDSSTSISHSTNWSSHEYGSSGSSGSGSSDGGGFSGGGGGGGGIHGR